VAVQSPKTTPGDAALAATVALAIASFSLGGEHGIASVLFGHLKLDTGGRYTRVANIRSAPSPARTTSSCRQLTGEWRV
jgi:hypothetical protein